MAIGIQYPIAKSDREDYLFSGTKNKTCHEVRKKIVKFIKSDPHYQIDKKCVALVEGVASFWYLLTVSKGIVINEDEQEIQVNIKQAKDDMHTIYKMIQYFEIIENPKNLTSKERLDDREAEILIDCHEELHKFLSILWFNGDEYEIKDEKGMEITSVSKKKQAIKIIDSFKVILTLVLLAFIKRIPPRSKMSELFPMDHLYNTSNRNFFKDGIMVFIDSLKSFFFARRPKIDKLIDLYEYYALDFSRFKIFRSAMDLALEEGFKECLEKDKTDEVVFNVVFCVVLSVFLGVIYFIYMLIKQFIKEKFGKG